MNELAKILNLADNASNDQITAAVKSLLSDKKQLEDKVATFEAEKATALKAEAISLVDGMIKEGRLSAESRETWLKLYDVDSEGTKRVLSGIPTRKPVTEQIEAAQAQGASATELSDLQSKTWDELDKQGLLITLRDKYPDVYKTKYKARFGAEATNV